MHPRIYAQARAYDIAFGFRDVAAECDALAALAARHGRGHARVLELACGPARHARAFARRGSRTTGLDLSADMLAYAAAQARAEGAALHTVQADMTDFALEARFELALMPMDSASYLLDNAAALAHLRCVAAHLVPGGLYVPEMSHPRDSFGVGRSTDTQWTMHADGWTVTTRWGEPGDAFDPVTQIDEVTVTLEWQGPEGAGRLVEHARQRRFTALEVDALVRAGGDFEIVEWLGALDPPRPFSADPAAWRMLPVLRRRATSPT